MKRLLLALSSAAAVGGLILGLVSLTSSGASASPQSTCQQYASPVAQEYDSSASLAQSYSSTAANVAAWDHTRLGPSAGTPPSQFDSLPPTDVLAVCYFSGSFDSFPMGPPQGDGSTGSVTGYETLILVVEPNEAVVVDAVGPANMPYGPPTTTASS